MNRAEFTGELQKLINRYSIENGSDTPDWILRDYLMGCLVAFEKAVEAREKFYGRFIRCKPGEPVEIPPTCTITPVDEAYVRERYKLDYGPRDEFKELLMQANILEVLLLQKEARLVNDEYTLKACDDELRRREQAIGKISVAPTEATE